MQGIVVVFVFIKSSPRWRTVRTKACLLKTPRFGTHTQIMSTATTQLHRQLFLPTFKVGASLGNRKTWKPETEPESGIIEIENDDRKNALQQCTISKCRKSDLAVVKFLCFTSTTNFNCKSMTGFDIAPSYICGPAVQKVDNPVH